MQVKTTRYNIYSYLRQTGEIVCGAVNDDGYAWSFEPFHPFFAMPEVEMFILSITEQCNLRCSYCCYSGEYKNNRTHGVRSMSPADIDEVYTFIQHVIRKRPVQIVFYGGEPLLQYERIKYAVEKALYLWPQDVSFSLSTNATLLSKEKADWLITHHVKLAISIDGTALFHDRYRIDEVGKGSFSRVYDALSYIVCNYPEYVSNIQLLMTLPSIEQLEALAEDWNEDIILHKLSPSQIVGLAPNFAKVVKTYNWDKLRDQYLYLLDIYERHQDWLVLKAFFNGCIAYWKDRPIVEVDSSVPMATCMPVNTKLYIDTNKQIAVCEKISDQYRIGNIKNGINWHKANELALQYYNKRVCRCTYCPAIRMCDLCLTAIEFNDEQWDVLCHNERVYARLYMLLFCEMAERGLMI
ncbi:MAG: radical SAM protein [Bacteroidaceae bacterium]|nr:radical SAM protein [Bacteroidaceae bacterium]